MEEASPALPSPCIAHRRTLIHQGAGVRVLHIMAGGGCGRFSKGIGQAAEAVRLPCSATAGTSTGVLTLPLRGALWFGGLL